MVRKKIAVAWCAKALVTLQHPWLTLLANIFLQMVRKSIAVAGCAEALVTLQHPWLTLLASELSEFVWDHFTPGKTPATARMMCNDLRRSWDDCHYVDAESLKVLDSSAMCLLLARARRFWKELFTCPSVLDL
jgi:hypothetical protein